VHSRKGQAEGTSTGRSPVFASDATWTRFSHSHGGGQTTQGCVTVEHGGTRATSAWRRVDGWMDGADKCPCASLQAFMWVYEKGIITSLSHLYLPSAFLPPFCISASKQANSLNLCLVTCKELQYIRWKKIQKFWGKRILRELTSCSGEQRNRFVRGLRKPRVSS